MSPRPVPPTIAKQDGTRGEPATLSAMVDHSLYLWLVQDEDPDGTEQLLDTLDAISIRALGPLPSFHEEKGFRA